MEHPILILYCLRNSSLHLRVSIIINPHIDKFGCYLTNIFPFVNFQKSQNLSFLGNFPPTLIRHYSTKTYQNFSFRKPVASYSCPNFSNCFICLLTINLGISYKKDTMLNPSKPSNTPTAGKFKLWKYDYFRDSDRDAMEDITKTLKKHRVKQKGSSKTSVTRTSIKAKSVSKMGHKLPSKPASKVQGSKQGARTRSFKNHA